MNESPPPVPSEVIEEAWILADGMTFILLGLSTPHESCICDGARTPNLCSKCSELSACLLLPRSPGCVTESS